MKMIEERKFSKQKLQHVQVPMVAKAIQPKALAPNVVSVEKRPGLGHFEPIYKKVCVFFIFGDYDFEGRQVREGWISQLVEPPTEA